MPRALRELDNPFLNEIILVFMGLMDRFRRGRMKDPVEGTFVVAAADHYVTAHMDYIMSFRVDGVVTAPGIPPTPIRRDPVVVLKRDWIQIGQGFPALVDRSDPKRAIVTFPSTKKRGRSSADSRQAAEDLARHLGGENGSQPN